MVNFWYFKLEECKGFETLNCAKWTVLKEADIRPIIWSYFSLDTGVEIHQSYGTICIAAFNNPDINLFTFSARFKQKNGFPVKSECFCIVNCDFPL